MSPPSSSAATPSASWLDRPLGLFAAALPFGLAVARAAGAGQWRDDLPSVRDLGLVAVGASGGLSTLVTQALSLVPLGSRTFRASIGGAIALAVAARLLYGLVRRVVAAAGSGQSAARSPKLAAALAAIATLTAALSPTWQREGTVGGGAMLATALTLAAFTLALRLADAPAVSPAPRDLSGSASAPAARTWIALGALFGAAVAESPPAGLAIAGVLGAIVAVRRFGRTGLPAVRLPSSRVAALTLLAAAFVAALLWSPLALRPLAPRAWADVGRAISAVSLSAFDSASARTTALSAWSREIGLVSLLIATFGAAMACLRGPTRAIVAPLGVLVLLDTLLPARAAGVLSADPLTSLRALAVASVAMGSALGIQDIVRRLLEARVPMARAASALVVVFHVTLIALTSEEAGYAADRSEQLAAEAWEDEALDKLPPRSAILVRSPALTWRLWSARLLRGERPDVVVIPVPLLDRGRVAASLVAAEPEIEPLLRDYALRREASEFSLSKIADVRPLHVEIDPSWPKRLLSHVTVSGLWLEYAPQPLGTSDRRLGTARSASAIQHVASAVNASLVPDAPTGNVLATTLRAHATALGTLGEGDAADTFLARLAEIRPADPYGEKVALPYAIKGVRRAMMTAKREPKAERAR